MKEEETPVKKGPEVTLPEEPSKDDVNSLEIIFRMPLSGERVNRRYLKTDKVQLLYDFIDHLQNEKKCQFEGVEGYCENYRLIQSMPRKLFTDKEMTLETAGFYPRGAML